MNDNLLPCPFCGNGASVVDDLITFHVECQSCGSTGAFSSYKTGAIEAWNRRASVAEAAQSLPDGWVMLDKNGVVHRYKWKRIEFFGSVDDVGTAFNPGEIEYETREWGGLAPFTVRPVSFMAPVVRHWPIEEQPGGTVIPVDPSELIAASPAQPVQPIHKPLTDDQINEAYGAARVQHDHIPHDDVVRIARAIEAAHGIAAPNPKDLPC